MNTSKITHIGFVMVLTFSLQAMAAFNDKVSVQGYLKQSGVALNDAVGFPMQVQIKRSGSVVWCQTLGANVPVVNGIFNVVLSGASNCLSLVNTLDASTFTHSANSDSFSFDVVVDVSKNGYGGADDAAFSGISITPVPLAEQAKHALTADTATSAVTATTATTASSATTANSAMTATTATTAGNVTGVVAIANGGTGAATSTAALTALLPSQAGASGKFLQSNGSTVSWGLPAGAGTITGVTAGAGLTGGGVSGAVTLAVDSSSTNTASKIVSRDGSGNFAAGTVTANLIGNVTGNVTGNVSGNATGTSANVTGVVAVANGGTGGADGATARANLGAAEAGANTNITSMSQVVAFSSGLKVKASGAGSTTLGHYEENTCSASLVGTTTAGVGTYTTNSCFFTRVGRLVTVNISLVWSAHTGTGSLRVNGLPYAANSTASSKQVCPISWSNMTYAGRNVIGEIAAGATSVSIVSGAASAGATAAVAMDTAASMYLTCSYHL